MTRSYLTVLVFLVSWLSSCHSTTAIQRDYEYFRTGSDTVLRGRQSIAMTTVKEYDNIKIKILSATQNQEQVVIFNVGADKDFSTFYSVNSAGYIGIPVLGMIKVSGNSLEQIQNELTSKLSNFIKSPKVEVRFADFSVNVLGEVRNPGIQKFIKDRVTILDALASAGDLSENGKRNNVLVIRESNGIRSYHSIDLRSRELFQSQVYILAPNDVVYVGPTKQKLASVNINPESQRKTGLILALTTVAVSIASLIVSVLR